MFGKLTEGDGSPYETYEGTVTDGNGDPQTQLVNEDGERVDGAQDNLRKAGDHFVYNTGVLSNRYNETVTVKASKEWKAAAFQADFEDAAVELRLQSRPAG